MALCYRLAGLARRAELSEGGRASDVDAVGNKVAVNAPKWPTADATDRLLVPLGAFVVPSGPAPEKAACGAFGDPF